MKKAIEILKNIDKIRDREYSIAFKDGWNSFSNENKQNCDFTIRHKEIVKLTNDDFISKAIKELEDLENRSCGNCKQFAKYENQDFGDCFGIARTLSDIDTVSKDFCCNKWEK